MVSPLDRAAQNHLLLLPALLITQFLSLLQLNLNAMKSRLSNPSEKVKSGASTPTAIKTPITIAKRVRLMVIFILFAVLSLLLSVLTTTLLKCKIEAIFSGFSTEFLAKVQ
jgi:hypothetical protein